MKDYVLILKDKLLDKTLTGGCKIYSSNLKNLKSIGVRNIALDSENVTAEIWRLNDDKTRVLAWSMPD